MAPPRNLLRAVGCEWLLAESIAAAIKGGVIKRASLDEVVLDTTVQPKAITYSTDSQLLNRAREQLVHAANDAGKRVTLWEQAVTTEGIQRPVRRVLRLIERRIDKHGQVLIVPQRTPEGWTTSLLSEQFSAAAIIALCADHGIHEQFHSEFKTDLDLTRLPSGKFDTNYVVCQLTGLPINILRLRRQRGLLGPDAPVRHSAKSRRIKTVMQELIYRARCLILGLGANDRAAKVFTRVHGEVFAATT